MAVTVKQLLQPGSGGINQISEEDREQKKNQGSPSSIEKAYARGEQQGCEQYA